MPFEQAVALTTISLNARMSQSIAAMMPVDATNGNKFLANRDTLLRVRNTSGGTVTVTVHSTGQRYGLAIANATFTVPPTTGDVLWTGFEHIFHHDKFKYAWVTYSSAAGVTAQVVQPL